MLSLHFSRFFVNDGSSFVRERILSNNDDELYISCDCDAVQQEQKINRRGVRVCVKL